MARIAIVTGGTRGIGRAICEALKADGLTVVANYAGNEERARAFTEETGIPAYRWDVGDHDASLEGCARVEAEVGPIDVLVNNAAVIARVPLLEMSLEDWNAVIHTDLTGVFVMTKPVVRRMIERGGGKVINVCSMMSELGRDSVGAYAAAKGGLKMLTRNMATEWARHNIQVNGIGPGYFATSQTAPLRVDRHPFNDFIVSRTPAARWGDPDDLAGAAIFLASAASNFVNGHILYVDGGILATIGRPIES